MKQRILHVIDHTNSGGAQVVIHYLVRALKESFSFAIAVLGVAGQFSDAYESLGVPVFTLGNRGGRWNPLPIVRLTDIIRRERFDLVHTHLFKASILGTVASKWVGSRTILHDHSGVYPQALLKYCFSNGLIRRGYICAYRYALSQCDRVLVLTPEDVRSYLKFYSLDPHKIIVLPNAVDFNEFKLSAEQGGRRSLRQELGLSANTRLIVMVGRLHPMKDWLTFLQVAQQVQRQSDQPCRFLVVGSGSEEQKLRDYVKVHKLEQVFFLGYRGDVPWLLQQADVFLLTSRCEPFGIVVLEAMAAGCPVIATHSSGPESILTNEVDGLLAEAGDVQGLASHITRLLHDDALCQRLVEHARQTALQRYSLKIIAARMANIYTEVLKQ